MGIVITDPVVGAALAGLAVVSLVLRFLPSHVRVAAFGTLLTAGTAQMAWSLLLGEGDAVAVSGHVAAGLGLLWSMAAWLMGIPPPTIASLKMSICPSAPQSRQSRVQLRCAVRKFGSGNSVLTPLCSETSLGPVTKRRSPFQMW